MIIELQNNNTDINKLYQYLQAVDADFKTPLSTKVNLLEYCSKIMQNGHVVAVVEDDEILSCRCFYCNDNVNHTAYGALMSTCEKARGKGYAKALIYKMIEICKKHGMNRIISSTVNPSAEKLYLSIGYSIIQTKNTNGTVCSVLEKKI